MKKINLQFIFILICLFVTPSHMAKDYIIYSVVQELPMGDEGEILKKNFYVNIGDKQGIEKGNVLDVFRVISRLDPYETKKRYNHKVKIGELEVLHTEEDSSIAVLKNINSGAKSPLFDIPAFMIGDRVDVKTR